MLQSWMDLVCELFAVDGAAAAAGAGRVAGLEHEVWDYAVEDYVVVVAALGEGGEVLARLWLGSMADWVGWVEWSGRRDTWGAWSL